MRFLAVFFAMVLPLLACAEAAKEEPTFVEGEHYTVLPGQPKPSSSGPIEVAEMFWYGCGHCYQFEPVLEPWKENLAEDVNFIRSPAMWRQRSNPADVMWTHAKLYYTASALGELDNLHMVFFEAMHKQNKRLASQDEIAALVSQHGVDGEVFVKTMESFAVNSQVQQADARQRAYRVTGTPEIVVGGYYHVSAQNAGSHRQMLEVANFLLDKIRAERS